MMNWHVRQWIRYQHFMAKKDGKQLAQLIWANIYNKEFSTKGVEHADRDK